MPGALAKAATTRRSIGILWRSISSWKASLKAMVFSDSLPLGFSVPSRLYQMCIRSKKWKRAASTMIALLALLFRAKEDGGAKDALESLNDPVVMISILRKVEVVEHLRRTPKADDAAFLENGQGGDPDGN